MKCMRTKPLRADTGCCFGEGGGGGSGVYVITYRDDRSFQHNISYMEQIVLVEKLGHGLQKQFMLTDRRGYKDCQAI